MVTETSNMSFPFAGENPFACGYRDFYFELAFCKRKNLLPAITEFSNSNFHFAEENLLPGITEAL